MYIMSYNINNLNISNYFPNYYYYTTIATINSNSIDSNGTINTELNLGADYSVFASLETNN